MKLHLQALAFSFLIATLLRPLGAAGETVTFFFTGNVTSIYNPYGVVGSSLINLGDPVQASLRYDTATPDWPLYVDDPTQGSFVGPGWLKVNIDGLNFEFTTGIRVDILHGANGGQEYFDAFAIGSPTTWPTALPTYTNADVSMAFWETQPPYDLLSNAELPVTMDFSRADHTLAFVRARTSNANMYEIQFNLQQVPEPTVASLLAGGLLLWVLRACARAGLNR